MARFPKRKNKDDQADSPVSDEGAAERAAAARDLARREREARRAREKELKREGKKPEAAKEPKAAKEPRRKTREPQAAKKAKAGAGKLRSRLTPPQRARGDGKPKGESTGNGKSRSARERAAPVKSVAGKILNPIEQAFVKVLAMLGAVLAGIWKGLVAVLRALAPPAQAAAHRLNGWLHALSKLVTPARGLLVAAIGCAVLLGLSQFTDYRGISIGADAYAPGIQSVAPAPEVEREELGTAHNYLGVFAAILAVLILLFATRTKRWQLCRIVVLLGIAAIVVTIVVDRPAGLDEGNLNRDFTGVEAKLLGGYWMQLFAGIGLALTSFLLAGELKRESRARAARADSRHDKPERPHPSERGPRRRLRLPRRTDTGGAGA